MEEVQRDHHKFVYDENEEWRNGTQKTCKTPQSETNFGESWEVALFPSDSGAELAKCQCCSRRTTKKLGGSGENATRSADQRKQLERENPSKMEAAQRGR